jgi:hypothetical protein
MANTQNRAALVHNAMGRAKKLMQLESNGTIDKITSDPQFRANIDASLTNTDAVLSESMMTTARDRSTQGSIATRQMGENASNVPQAIREAFMNNPIDDSALYDAMAGDGRDISFLTEGLEQPKEIVKPSQNVRQIVNEGIGTQTQMQYTQTAQIDYPMIRTIVEEIVRKYAVSLNKKIISEGKQAQSVPTINTIALGETFKFLDSEGNIYEGKLVKKGNIKKKNVNG